MKEIGQLKRKGKFDESSEHMKRKSMKGFAASQDAISSPGAQLDATSLLGNPNSRSVLDDINANAGLMPTGDVGDYKPTEFIVQPKVL